MTFFSVWCYRYKSKFDATKIVHNNDETWFSLNNLLEETSSKLQNLVFSLL